MINPNLVKNVSLDKSEIEREAEAALATMPAEQLSLAYEESIKNFEAGTVLKGRVIGIVGSDVVVDVGYKSEGVIPLIEFDDPTEAEPSREIEVLLELVEDDSGLIRLSKRKADRIRAWQRLIAEHKEGDVVTGKVTRKIKGGLLVDVGVPVFLPASQVDIRRPGDIAEYIGQTITAKILKIDVERRNIVVSRRKLIEEEREKQKAKLLTEIQVGEIRKGVVKNIADFGAFVDLGGIDGLLHITDMSWGRISHPSEMVAIDDDVEVVILKVDKEKEKIALGLKQKTASPWADIETKYPVGSKAKGQVVNIMPYGAFVKLETGVEGLVHISEMSWTHRVNHPSEIVAIGDTVEVVILGINKEKEEISLGMKQTEQNPWTTVEQRYPPGTRIKGRVRHLTSYGAFVELEEGIDGLLHVSDMSWTKKVTHPSEVLKKGDKIEAVVLQVHQAKKRVALGLKQLTPDPWESEIPSKYQVGEVIRGKVTKLTSFGVFVELTSGLEGLLHISELSDKKVNTPEEIVRPGDEVDVRVIRVEKESRKIGLSLKKIKGLPDDARQPAIISRAPEPPKAEAPKPAEGTQPTEDAKPAEGPAGPEAPAKAEATATAEATAKPETEPSAPTPESKTEGDPKKE